MKEPKTIAYLELRDNKLHLVYKSYMCPDMDIDVTQVWNWTKDCLLNTLSVEDFIELKKRI